MTLPLPLGKSQFLDGNGNPLAMGRVYHYIPGTSTPKDTWQNAAQTILNTNPVSLDGSGMATIWGSGSYRQVAVDKLGNQIWDQVTATADTLSFVPLSGGTMTGTLTAPSISDTGGQLLTVTPTADAVTTKSSLNVQGTTSSTTTREYLAAISMISNKRNGTSGTVSPSTSLYTGIQAQSGTDDVWAIRANMVQDAASGIYDAIGMEIDANNNNAHRGDTTGSGGLATPVTYGMAISNTGAFRNTAAHLITGPGTAVHNRGIVVANDSVAQVAFQDLGTSTISYEIQGTHTYGFDMKAANLTGAAIRLGQGQYIKARDVGDTTDIKMMVQSGTQLIIGDAFPVQIFAQTYLSPLTDNQLLLGQNGLRWNAVWAANGTIQTSDPDLKADIGHLADLPPGTIATILSSITPIHFRWKDGGKDAEGNSRPGKRTHWGWNAAQIKDAFDAIGMDFGGFVKGDDGTRNLRPDQLLPVLWRAVQELSARVATLEAK